DTSRFTEPVAPASTESWSGRSSSSSPPSELSPASSSLDRAYRLRSATPSQSSSGLAPSIPQTQAYASLVIGRTTPTGEKSALASRLKRDDFPLPVPPARTTTV